jgi:hypothetical protein
MSRAATSVFVFGIYLAAVGAIFLVAPNLLLGVLGFPPTNEVWIRVAGVLVLILAYYFIQSARRGTTGFFRWTVHVRFTVIFVLTGWCCWGWPVRP